MTDLTDQALDDATKKKICELLKSANKEMCNLAVTMFCGLTRQYSDYYDVRTLYDGNSLSVNEENARGAFHQMFNTIDRETLKIQYRKKMKDYRRTTLNSKQKRKQHKEHFKEAQLCTKTN